MPYLQNILDAEVEAKAIVDAAEQEAARVLLETRTALTKKEIEAHDACASERVTSLEAHERELGAEREKVLTNARAEVAKLREQVQPKQRAAVAYIQALMVK